MTLLLEPTCLALHAALLTNTFLLGQTVSSGPSHGTWSWWVFWAFVVEPLWYVSLFEPLFTVLAFLLLRVGAIASSGLPLFPRVLARVSDPMSWSSLSHIQLSSAIFDPATSGSSPIWWLHPTTSPVYSPFSSLSRPSTSWVGYDVT